MTMNLKTAVMAEPEELDKIHGGGGVKAPSLRNNGKWQKVQCEHILIDRHRQTGNELKMRDV